MSLSGNRLPAIYGIQANIGYLLYDNYTSCLSVEMLFGERKELAKKNFKFQYAGLAADFNWHGLAFEVGWGMRTKNKHGFFLMQIGYSYRFI